MIDWKNIKFFIVGGTGVIINYGVYKAFLYLGVPNDISWLLGILFSAQSNYILSAKWVFKDG